MRSQSAVNPKKTPDIKSQLASLSQVNQGVTDAEKGVQLNIAKGFLHKMSSKERKLSVEQLVQERLKIQPDLVKAYPNMPVIEEDDINTFTDYAYAVHDQAEYLRGALDEIKSMHDNHFMTKRNKVLLKEKRELENELSEFRSSRSSAT